MVLDKLAMTPDSKLFGSELSGSELSDAGDRWRQLSPAALAYLGDAVYELHVRHHHLFPPQRVRTSHDRVVAQVRAEMQAHHLQTWLPHLNDRERALARRARNTGWKCPKRTDPATYQQATSFEALVGYFYLQDPDRLAMLMGCLDLDSQHPTATPNSTAASDRT
jgi:ribonuclease-3 family protein